MRPSREQQEQVLKEAALAAIYAHFSADGTFAQRTAAALAHAQKIAGETLILNDKSAGVTSSRPQMSLDPDANAALEPGVWLPEGSTEACDTSGETPPCFRTLTQEEFDEAEEFEIPGGPRVSAYRIKGSMYHRQDAQGKRVDFSTRISQSVSGTSGFASSGVLQLPLLFPGTAVLSLTYPVQWFVRLILDALQFGQCFPQAPLTLRTRRRKPL